MNISSGIISTFAGNGTCGYGGNGDIATKALFNKPQGMSLSESGDLYIADDRNSLIRKINSSCFITTFAGNYSLGAGYTGDGGLATMAQLNHPFGVAVSGYGDVYIYDTDNSVIRMVNNAGIISTVAGSVTGNMPSVDGSNPFDVFINNPVGSCIVPTGELYISA